MPWRLDGKDPEDRRSADQVRDDAAAARDRGRAAFENMVQREKEQEEAEARDEIARREQRRARREKLLRRRR